MAYTLCSISRQLSTTEGHSNSIWHEIKSRLLFFFSKSPIPPHSGVNIPKQSVYRAWAGPRCGSITTSSPRTPMSRENNRCARCCRKCSGQNRKWGIHDICSLFEGEPVPLFCRLQGPLKLDSSTPDPASISKSDLPASLETCWEIMQQA